MKKIIFFSLMLFSYFTFAQNFTLPNTAITIDVSDDFKVLSPEELKEHFPKGAPEHALFNEKTTTYIVFSSLVVDMHIINPQRFLEETTRNMVDQTILVEKVVEKKGEDTLLIEMTIPHPKGEKFGLMSVFPHEKKTHIMTITTPNAKFDEQETMIRGIYESLTF